MRFHEEKAPGKLSRTKPPGTGVLRLGLVAVQLLILTFSTAHGVSTMN